MKHFLEISQLSYKQAYGLIDKALAFKVSKQYPNYSDANLANLFYENSTRTRISFELAAHKLGVNTVNLDLATSSEQKGEVIEDTAHTLAAMGINILVLRHKNNGFPQAISGTLHGSVSIINAGDGTNAHPSQALLDFMTIAEYKPNLADLKIAIVGDIRHSRVANSLQRLAALLGVKDVVCVAPQDWQAQDSHARLTSDMQDGLQDADVVICLRVQKERIVATEQLDLATYSQNFAVTKQTLAYAKPDALLMHPGPINRGLEISSDVADGENSVILKQVENGVFMRMAIIDSLLS